MDLPLDLLQDPEHALRLVALEDAHIVRFAPLFQDVASLRVYLPALARPFNEAQLRGMLADWHDASSSFVFTILYKEEVAGLCTLESVDWVNRSAETGVALLPGAARGKGVARAAMALLLGFCFHEMGMHRIQARIQEGNDRSVRLFEGLGFVQEGLLREAVFRSGHWKGFRLYALLDREFLAR
jgi:RimJ/RimL family protein N-acetyltransferase